MSWYQTWDGRGVDRDQVQLVEFDRVLTIDARVAGSESNLARSRVDQPSMFIVGLIRQRGGDLLNVNSFQAEHPVSVGPEKVACAPERLEGAARLAADRRT